MGSGNHRNGLMDYLRYHPPGVIFLLCLLSFAVSTCVLTLYVNPGASVRNPDNLDWSTLLSETANLHFCMDNASMVSPSPSTVSRLSSSKTENDSTKMANLSVLVSVDPTWRKELTSYGEVLAVSTVRLRDMGRVVPHQYKSQDIVISFVLDPSDLSDKMCLNVRAPDFILKDMSAGRNSSKSGQASSVPDTNCTVTVPAGNRTVNVTSESGNEVPHGWCPEGTVFRIGLEGDPSWTVDLSGQDLSLIHMHLLATSVFLFVVIGVVVLTIFIRGVLYRRRRQSSSRQQLRNEDEEDDSEDLIY